jgi:hypothetical protein
MRRNDDNIRKDIKEIGINTRNWVYSAQDKDYQGYLDFIHDIVQSVR